MRALWAWLSLQHGYASTEEYCGRARRTNPGCSTCLALDLRRGIQVSGSTTCYAMDPDGQGLKINVPDLYQFNANDPQHLNPILVRPTYDATTQTAYYNGSGSTTASGTAIPYQVIAYRFNPAGGSITRSDPWAAARGHRLGRLQRRASRDRGKSNMEAFPAITPDPSDISGNTVHYGVSFHSTFQTLATTSNGTDITLRNVTFIRSKNLAH